MNWGWAESLDQLWRSPTLPVWLMLAVVSLFGLILLVTLLRAERSVANGTLAVLTLVAIGIALFSTMRSPAASDAVNPSASVQTVGWLPALSCLNELAGETVLTSCEKSIFASPDSAAAAVAHTAAQLNRLTAIGDVAAANRVMTAELQGLRTAIERDRYGLVAYVLATRDRCKPNQCAAYASLTSHNQIAANMEERVYEASVSKYASTWNAAAEPAGTTSLMAPTQPTGKPTNADFPTAASIPPVSIMAAEPPLAAQQPVPTPRPAAPRPTAAAAAPKKQPAAKARPSEVAPVRLAPQRSAPPPADRDQ